MADTIGNGAGEDTGGKRPYMVAVGGFTGEFIAGVDDPKVVTDAIQEYGTRLAGEADYVVLAVPAGDVTKWQERVATAIGVTLEPGAGS